jgi:glycerol-3-phosphate O-acyltransferase / dihydroxyacetone phosphate acyltransferase
VVANHPNSLLDPLIIFRTAGRPTRPMAKAPLFDDPIMGTVLRALGGLPVYRREDEAGPMERNEETFAAAVAALRRGEAIQIYPEGRSHSEPRVVPLRTGASRLALRAEAESGWRLGLRIVPVGLTYTRKAFFRGRAVVAIGEPFAATHLAETYATDPAAAVRELTTEIMNRIAALTVEAAADDDLLLIDVADRIYAREKRWTGWLERERLGERLPRLQEFSRGLHWLRHTDPERAGALARRVRSYDRRHRRLRSAEAEPPPAFQRRDVLRYLLQEIPLLLIGLPIAAAALLAWWLPVVAPRVVVRLTRPVPESVATYKLGAAMAGSIVGYAGWLALAGFFFGARVAAVAAVVLPLLGVAAIRCTGQMRRVLDDARLVLVLRRRPDVRRRLAEERAAIAGELDRVRSLLPPAEASMPPGRPQIPVPDLDPPR